jgi:beta-lactamase class A
MKSLFFFFALALPAPAAAGADEAARAAAALAAPEPRGAEELFDREFFAQLSLEKLNALFLDLYRERGEVSATLLVSSGAWAGHYFYDTAGGWRVPVAVSLNPRGGKIKGFFLGPPYRKSAALAAARDRLAALPGRKGLLVRRLGKNPETLESLSPDDYFAVASVSDLYVLGALLEGKTPWRKVFRPRAVERPAGSPPTAYELAALMISEDDRAAADALIGGLGRRRIEALLPALGHGEPKRLRPFLKTSEALRLNAGTEAALKYLNLPPGGKYAFLDALAAAAPAAAPGPRSTFGVDKIGWQASPADLCRLMEYFAAGANERALGLLALKPGLPAAAKGFAYAGYKGGFGPGVLSAVWLLEDKKGRWTCLAAAWNDGAGDPAAAEFSGALGGALASLAAAD